MPGYPCTTSTECNYGRPFLSFPTTICAAIDMEFNLYVYHFMKLNGNPAMGFLHNMFS
jgi:hypothetical protein